ncbi:thioesterase family protein [Amycolatopsis acidicola]|uniref:Thioesterase family protein n=1 Tax=Amycolatopsis acidicola TaxID=2596893 RepID=A0A5N0V0X9_9PSEU|nr:acyl-CoA thioesterase domain-containing protein [Amycolatopsis acidicola]KAA9156578.1 thioesterase family protein [Amycolatopsis acidicola]
MTTGYFRAESRPDKEILHPQPSAFSRWGSGDQLRGMAVSGLLARAAEPVAQEGGAALQPARWTLDLLRPASADPCVAVADVVRRGRRLCLVEAFLYQKDKLVARASGLFLATSLPPDGRTWSPAEWFSAPPPALHPTSETEPRLYYSEKVGWTSSPAQHQNAARKMLWQCPYPVVLGEKPTPFQHTAMAADIVNLVANWGDHGIEFINADVTLALARLPEAGAEVGLAAELRVEHEGVATGTATVFDRTGALGTATVTGLRNGPGTVDPRDLNAG